MGEVALQTSTSPPLYSPTAPAAEVNKSEVLVISKCIQSCVWVNIMYRLDANTAWTWNGMSYWLEGNVDGIDTWDKPQFFYDARAHSGPGRPHYRGFMITVRHAIFSMTPLNEWSARRRDLYLTTHNTHKRQTAMSPAGFEPALPARELLQTYALDRAVTGIGPIASIKSTNHKQGCGVGVESWGHSRKEF
jgi:hypothetical protein